MVCNTFSRKRKLMCWVFITGRQKWSEMFFVAYVTNKDKKISHKSCKVKSHPVSLPNWSTSLWGKVIEVHYVQGLGTCILHHKPSFIDHPAKPTQTIVTLSNLKYFLLAVKWRPPITTYISATFAHLVNFFCFCFCGRLVYLELNNRIH